MAHNILLTGASGYLGGDLLGRWSIANLPAHGTLFVLTRKPEQADVVKKLGATPIEVDLADESAVAQALTEHSISLVLLLIQDLKMQSNIIKALAKVKEQTGRQTHYINTTGAKGFSVSFAHAPADRQSLRDDAPDLLEVVQKMAATPSPIQKLPQLNVEAVELGEKHGVTVYLFAPCMVYGRGKSQGNPISKQTTAIIKAARATGQVYAVDKERVTWPVCHISDNSALWLAIVHSILSGKDIPSGKRGFYLASAGSVAWRDLYAGIASALHDKGLIKTAKVIDADEDALKQIEEVLGGDPQAQMGGLCYYDAHQGATLGWKPRYSAEDAIKLMRDEVELVLEQDKV